ncbi:MAG: sugar ABC transporter permease [Chloroflexi bacterium]|nr:sugar ABC transporter permease [Chloroflexota bacterium]MBK6711355.1 sugar ABC transporter permease [Chloroflexota bacterium]MBK7176357.1 sugar ABC transporter permease [Chloroflexota bacterium]MBK7915765.1 sugar ABC transporter permease [Chloroflexota bacterium]MBK8931256.1 sugar ABC transporter permease [Chloroflexota bacterium]
MLSVMQSYNDLRSSQKFRKRFSIWVRLFIALFLIFFSIFPVLWIISASFDNSQSLATQTLIPANAGLNNYRDLFGLNPDYQFGDLYYWKWVWNSVKVAAITTVLSISITTMAAYAFSRLRFTGRVTMLKGILLIQVFPNLLALVAIYLLVFQFGEIIPAIGLNTHAGLILVYLGGSMGLNIWLMKGFMDTIPRAIDESGMMDGATHFQIFWRLLLPLLRPMLVVIGILSFIGTYGDFILARILLTDVNKYTLMVGLQIFTAGQFDKKWGVFAAGALIGALPILITYLALQDQIAGGLTQGAVKE